MQITMGQVKFCSNFGFGCILPTKGRYSNFVSGENPIPSRLPAPAGLPFPLAFLLLLFAAAAPFIPSPASKGTTYLVAFRIHFLSRRAISMGTLGRAIYAVGFWIRETGQAIDRLGSRLQGNYLFQEQSKWPPFFASLFDSAIFLHAVIWVAVLALSLISLFCLLVSWLYWHELGLNRHGRLIILTSGHLCLASPSSGKMLPLCLRFKFFFHDVLYKNKKLLKRSPY